MPSVAEDRNLRILAESLPQIVWTALPDGRIDYMNKRWFEFSGLTEEETYGETRTVVHSDDIGRYREQWHRAVETGTVYEIEYRFRRASDGMYRWHLGRGLPVCDKSGRVLKWFGTCTDIHDQKEAEREIRRLNEELEKKVSERTKELEQLNTKLKGQIAARERLEVQERASIQRLSSIVDTMPIGALITDEKDTVIHVNERFRHLFHIDAALPEILNLPLRKLKQLILMQLEKHGKDAHVTKGFLRGIHSMPSMEWKLKDGRVILRESLPITVHAKNQGKLFLYRDVTQERKMDKAKSEFMSLASHQLRTPLTTIRWALGRLERQLKVSGSLFDAALLRTAKSGAVQMAETINTMLQISRVEAGKMRIDASWIRLDVFLEELKDEFQEQYELKSQSFELLCERGLFLHTDPKVLYEIASNLISNAIKYTPAKGKISVHAGKKNGRLIFISVRDTGYGIPEHQQRCIFSKFFRGENIVDIEPNGTGLGLYLVYLMTNILDAKLTFASRVNAGTTFTLGIPMKDGEQYSRQ